MKTDILSNAAALLDDIASNTLSHGDFYYAMEQAGMMSVDLCKLVMRNHMLDDSPEYSQIMLAAECLKDICIAQNNDKLKAALSSAKMHSNNLYRISERMGQV